MATIGLNSVASFDYSFSNTFDCKRMELSSYTPAEAETLTEFQVYALHDFGGADRTIPVAVYRDDTNALVGSVQNITVPNAASFAWHSVTGLSIALEAGVAYKIALGTPSSTIKLKRNNASGHATQNGATTLGDPWVENSVYDYEFSFYATTEASGATLTAPASISPGETIAFTCSFAPTGVTASDGTSTLTLTSITNTSGDSYTAVAPALPSVGDSLQYTTFGAVTLSATDGTSTAEDTTTLAAAAGQTVTILAETFDTSELSYLFDFGGTPATGDQFIEGSAQLALDANGGYVADTDGTYVITGIDATDGIAQSYNLILGDVVAAVGRLTRRNLTSRKLTRRSLTARP